MSALSLEYSDKQIQEAFTRLQQRVRDVRPALKEIGEHMLLSTDRNFSNERAPDGTPWPPNSPRTIAQKRAQGRILKVLQNRGRLRASINYRVAADSVSVGSDVSYAPKHMLGDGVPQRVFLGVSDSDRVEILAIINRHLTKEN